MRSKQFNWIALISVLISFTYCTTSLPEDTHQNSIKNYFDIEKAGWLIGSWQNVSENEISTEIWEKKNDSVFIAKSFVLVNKDTVFSETISIERHGRSLFYIPTVKEQNQGQAVEFLMIECLNNKLVFENLKHDFPQKISYTKITHDSIVAEISGIEEGKQKSILFPFTRKK